MTAQVDKAEKTYWESRWEDSSLSLPADPRSRRWNNYFVREVDRFLCRTIAMMSPRPGRLLEIGCANSQWLPYFAREHGLDVWGIDYTDVGCARSREIMRRCGLDPDHIVCADLFQPPAAMEGAFDVLVSFGVIEHFADTADCIRACARYLRPGGTVISLIPNQKGLNGFLQKHLDRSIFDKHVPLNLTELIRAHELAGLKALSASHFCFVNFGVLDLGQFGTPELRRFMMLWGCRLSWVLGRIHEAGVPLLPNRITSSYMGCAATKALQSQQRPDVG